MDFPTWFSIGCYSGLACCMFAIAVNALFTSLCRRGTTRQLAGTIVICVIAALLLLPAIAWYNMRFSAIPTQVTSAEVELMLVYVALWGWGLPLGVTVTYCLFTLPRSTTTAMHIPRQNPGPSTTLKPPRHQVGVVSPFVFNAETPWGWLEYYNGSFHGQRLALNRAIVTLGRNEDNDIWIDDEMASRYHAELAYDQGKVYLTDCDSLNGVLLNGKRLRGTLLLEMNDKFQIGALSFNFILANPNIALAEQSDPLARHIWHSSMDGLDGLAGDSYELPITPPSVANPPTLPTYPDETAEIDYKTPQPPATNTGGALIIRDGEMTGQSFSLDRAVISVGRDQVSDIVINDASISRKHVQFLRQPDGDYVQDLESRNGTQVNNETLRTPKLLCVGDIVSVGNIRLEYALTPTEHIIPLSRITSPQPSASPISGPTLLRLPSKQKQ